MYTSTSFPFRSWSRRQISSDREPNATLFIDLAESRCSYGTGAIRAMSHISLSGLENCHNNVLEACKEKGRMIPFVLYDLRHTFSTRAAQNGMPLPTLASVLGHSSLRQVQKYVHPTQDHQQAEMDRIDIIRQEAKRQHVELLRSQAHGRPTATGKSGDFAVTDGHGQERLQ